MILIQKRKKSAPPDIFKSSVINMKQYLFFILFFLGSTIIYSQEKTKMKLADSYFDAYDYLEAVHIYEKSAKKTPTNVYYLSRTAKCYSLIGNTQKAEQWYGKLANMENVDPLYIFYYAGMLEANKKYDEAKKQYEKYKIKNPADSRTINKMNNVGLLPLFYKDSSFYRVKNLSINSKNSDFGFFPFGGERFLFTSNRNGEVFSKSTDNANKYSYLGLCRVNRNTDGSFDPIQPVWKEMNSAYNEGPVFFEPSNSVFYITRNSYDKKQSATHKDGINKLQISIARFDGSAVNGIFDFVYNSSEYSVGHATVSKDGQHLYFVSDMPGGFGGTDIYVCTKEGGSWGKPKNLGKKINTEGNELFPFISEQNKLYFSSDGFSGLGGLDIYFVETENTDLQTPNNLGYPINSNKDDFSFYTSTDGKSGFFSSNRDGGKGDDDIYSFDLIKPLKAELQGIVRNQENETPIVNAKVVLIGFNDKPVEKITDLEGKFSFAVEWNRDYSISASKEKFTTGKQQLSTSGANTPFQIEIKIKRSDFNLEAKVINAENKIPLSNAKITIVNSNKESKTLVSDASGTFMYSLESASVYEVMVEKPKFMTNMFVVSTLDMSPSTIRKTFSLEEIKVGDVFMVKNITYDIITSNIRNAAKPELDKLVTILKDNPTMEIELGSHSDSRGDDETNMFLSDKCVKAAVAYIVSKGILQRRVTGIGYGETKPLNRCKNGVKCSEEEFQINNRTEIKVIKI
jgi:outer membrane protein OmpA-like peptidoglycan-associated protein/tetratricopeptide (TPR) repeat protein